MADHNIGNAADLAFQRFVTTLVLDHIASAGFALAGSGAIREHGITDRLTHDVDLFTTTATSPEAFADAVAEAEAALTSHGYRVIRTRITPEFARLLIETSDAGEGKVVEVDFGIDWRNEPPTQLAIGPVLALRDAVGSKVAAVYSRGEPATFSTSTRYAGPGDSPTPTYSRWRRSTTPVSSSATSSTSSNGSTGSGPAAPAATASTPNSSTRSRPGSPPGPTN